MTQTTIFDICERKSRGHENSRAANLRAAPRKAALRARIAVYLAAYQTATLKDLCAAFNVREHQVSGRLAEMKQAFRIRETGERRDGCAVVELVKEAA